MNIPGTVSDALKSGRSCALGAWLHSEVRLLHIRIENRIQILLLLFASCAQSYCLAQQLTCSVCPLLQEF